MDYLVILVILKHILNITFTVWFAYVIYAALREWYYWFKHK
nr:MAG TPA: hypothetical protein [Caudoviricetes sp.]